MNHRTLIVASLGLVAVLGCHDGSGDGGAGSYATPSAFCRAYDSHWAVSQYRCGGGQGTPSQYYMSNCAVLDDELAAGRIEYDQAAAADCLAQVDKDPGIACSDDVPCLWSVIKGHVAEGAPCKDYTECGPHSVCASASTDSCEPFVCISYGANLGEACGGADNVTCAGSLLCQLTGDSTEGTCVMRTAGRPCADFSDCSFVEYCDTTAGVCKPRLPIGASCAEDPTACAVLAHCDETNKCAAGGTVGKTCGLVCWNSWCAPPELVDGDTCKAFLADGSPCTESFQCKSGVCADGVCAACAP